MTEAPARPSSPFTLLLLSALSACTPKGGGAGGGDVGEGDTGPLPVTVELLAPTNGLTWFVGVRYDVVAHITGTERHSVSIEGADFSCDPFADGWVHCSAVANAEAAVKIGIVAQGDDGEGNDSHVVHARRAVGVVPEGDQFALGMYEVMNNEWFSPIAGAGIPLVQSYGTGGYTQEQWQDWAAAAGTLTMTRTSWSWSDPWGAPSSDETLAALAARPELAWWELPDNAVEDDSYADEVSALVGRIHVYDDRPTFMYLWTSITTEQIEAYVPDLDIISPGTYPEHACQPQPWIRWRIESAREAVENSGYTAAERPVVGTADLYGQPEESCPDRVATLPQVRMNPLAMMAAGAQGSLYFAWYYAVYSLDAEWGELALDTAELILGESGLGFAVVHGEPRGDLAVTVTSGPETSEAFTPLHTSELIEYPSIHAAAWDYAGTRFVIAVNYTEEPVTAELAGLPSLAPHVEVVGEARELTQTDGRVTDSFAPWDAHVYRAPIIGD